MTDAEALAYITNPDGSFRWPHADKTAPALALTRQWSAAWKALCNTHGLQAYNCTVCKPSLVYTHRYFTEHLPTSNGNDCTIRA